MEWHEIYVSLETAKLLKEAGFDCGCYAHWVETDKSKETAIALSPVPILYSGMHPLDVEGNYDIVIKNWNNEKNEFQFYYSAPTLAVAQKWLREVKDYHCFIEYDGLHRTYQCRIDSYVHIYDIKHREWINNYEEFSTYEEALEAGIKKCLEIILEKR